MEDKTTTEQIDDIVKLYGGWKADNLSQLRGLIESVDPKVTAEVKWRMASRPEGLPVWYCDGIICLLETFKNDQKLVFTKGALMKDPEKLFNARLNSSTDRAIQLNEGDVIDEAGVKALVLEAIQLNASK